jgi:hypothetical protein
MTAPEARTLAPACFKMERADPSLGLPAEAFYLAPIPIRDVDAPPSEHLVLFGEVSQTLQVLAEIQSRLRPPPKKPTGNTRAHRDLKRRDRLRSYYVRLAQIADVGLTGTSPQPGIALPALTALEEQILGREGRWLKTRHMTQLGRAVGSIALPAVALAALAPATESWDWLDTEAGLVSRAQVRCFALLVASCAVGVWLSFGARTTTMTFDDLRLLEQDFLGARGRVVFAEVLTVALAVLFSAGVIVLKLGRFELSEVLSVPLAAVLIGLLCGVSERALPRQLTSQSRRLFKDELPPSSAAR